MTSPRWSRRNTYISSDSILHQSIPLINLKTYNILIIEFNQSHLQALTNTLKKIGVGQSNIMTARTESVARSILDTKVIDLIFIRYWMPNTKVNTQYNVVNMLTRLLKDKSYGLSPSSHTDDIMDNATNEKMEKKQQQEQIRMVYEQNLKSLQSLINKIKVIIMYDPLCVEEQDAIFASDPSGHRLTQAWAGGSQRQIVEPIITSALLLSNNNNNQQPLNDRKKKQRNDIVHNNILSNVTLKLPINGEPQRIEELKMKLYHVFLMNDVV